MPRLSVILDLETYRKLLTLQTKVRSEITTNESPDTEDLLYAATPPALAACVLKECVHTVSATHTLAHLKPNANRPGPKRRLRHDRSSITGPGEYRCASHPNSPQPQGGTCPVPGCGGRLFKGPLW